MAGAGVADASAPTIIIDMHVSPGLWSYACAMRCPLHTSCELRDTHAMVVQYVPMICYAYPGIKAGAFAAIFYAYLIPIACTDVLFDATTRRFLDVRLTHSSVLLPVLLASSEVPRRYSPTPSLSPCTDTPGTHMHSLSTSYGLAAKSPILTYETLVLGRTTGPARRLFRGLWYPRQGYTHPPNGTLSA
eukprot:3673343-Rhodomonas_salina.1